MDEAKVKEIHNATDLRGYEREELEQADYWVKLYALDKLTDHLNKAGVTNALKAYVMLMARCHYGSVETDEFLQAHHCYPDWVR